jgi:hypothetical protein
MEYILWIALIAQNGATSQQAALFPTEQACLEAQGSLVPSLEGAGQASMTQTRVRVVSKCLPFKNPPAAG